MIRKALQFKIVPRFGTNKMPITLLFFFLIYFLFIYLFLAALGLHCCSRAFSRCGERGLLFVAAHGLLISVAFLVSEHRLEELGLQ